MMGFAKVSLQEEGSLCVLQAWMVGTSQCVRRNQSYNSNEFCAFLGGKLFNITKHEFF